MGPECRKSGRLCLTAQWGPLSEQVPRPPHTGRMGGTGDVNCGSFLVLGAGNERDTWGRELVSLVIPAVCVRALWMCRRCSNHLFGKLQPCLPEKGILESKSLGIGDVRGYLPQEDFFIGISWRQCIWWLCQRSPESAGTPCRPPPCWEALWPQVRSSDWEAGNRVPSRACEYLQPWGGNSAEPGWTSHPVQSK